MAGQDAVRAAVAGGTGATGRQVVAALAAAGHEPVVLARSRGVDLVAGTGLDEALDGVRAVIDVSDLKTVRRSASVAFFDAAGRNLVAAGRRAGVRHHVALSIVGCDRVDNGYYHGKRRQEQLLAEGGTPWSVLRATQFHEFARDQVLARALGPLVLLPRMRVRPVAIREVAAALAALAVGDPAGTVELACLREEQMTDLVRRLVHAQGRRRLLVPVRLPGAAGRAMAEGALLPTALGPRGTETFDEWLAAEELSRAGGGSG